MLGSMGKSSLPVGFGIGGKGLMGKDLICWLLLLRIWTSMGNLIGKLSFPLYSHLSGTDRERENKREILS